MSNPDNTLRNELAEIMQALVLFHSPDHQSVEPKLTYSAEEATDAILLAIKNRLPKEKIFGDEPSSYEDGYNSAIEAMEQALDIESES